LPDTTYHATFRTGQQLDGVPPVEPSSATWEFTTGSSAAPALELHGELRVTLEQGQDPIYTCTNDCGGGCVQAGSQPVTKARLKVPGLLGGFGKKFSSLLLLSDDTPGSFDAPSKTEPEPRSEHAVWLEQLGEIDPSAPGDVLITLPHEEQPYKPCFAFKVWDDRGQEALADPVCLDDTFPSVQPPLGNNGSAGTTGSASMGYPLADDTVKPHRKSSGCSVSSASHGVPSALALLVALAALSRRRQPKSAP
jgi:MYXO-CTERM domain-containing protein